MTRLVEYCLDNADGEARERLAALPGRTRATHCLQRCGTCYREAFAVVDGDPVICEDHEALAAALEGSE